MRTVLYSDPSSRKIKFFFALHTYFLFVWGPHLMVCGRKGCGAHSVCARARRTL